MWRNYPEVQAAIATINRVIAILERNGNGFSKSIRRELTTINTAPVVIAKEGFYSIGQMCHPKCLGDVCPRDLDSEQWFRELDELEDACARAFNRIDAEAEKLRAQELNANKPPQS